MALHVCVAARKAAPHRFKAATCFASGLMRHGVKAEVSPDPLPCDILVKWTWDGTEHEFAEHVFVMECGYLNGKEGSYTERRTRYVSTIWNGLNGKGYWARGLAASERARKHGFVLRDWIKAEPGPVVIMGQMPSDKSCSPREKYLRWLSSISKEALERFGANAVFRPHPLQPNGNRRNGGARLDISVPQRECVDWRDGAQGVITWNSTIAVEAVMAGIPTTCYDSGSMAYDMCTHDLHEEPIRPDREGWLNDLMHAQWTHEELSSGECWEFHRQHYLSEIFE